MTRPAHMPISAIALIITACACFTSIDVTVKYLSQRYPVPLLVWARWGVQALLMFALLAPRMRWKLVRTAQPGLHLVRGTVLIVSSLCFFSAVKYLPLAEATALNYTSPILVTLLAGWLLRERITLPRWGFAAAGFIGMLLIVRPGTEMLSGASLFALAAAAAYAGYQILTRQLAGEDLRVLLFYPCLCGAVLMSIVVAFEAFTNVSHYKTRPGPPGQPDQASLSYAEYGPKTGVWRVLELLDREQLKASFHVSGLAAQRWP